MSRHLVLRLLTQLKLCLAGAFVCGVVLCAEDSAPVANGANGREPDPTAEAAALVEQLGDDSYEVRREAADRLRNLGMAAHDALLEGLKAPDTEIRRSSRRILALVLDAEYEARITAFINDRDGGVDHKLAGWKTFKSEIGDDTKARELFVQMHREESGLLESYEVGAGAAADALRHRFVQLYQQIYNRNGAARVQPSLGTIAALVFVGGDESLDLPADVVNHNYWQSFIQQPAFQTALRGGEYQPYAQKLVGRWMMLPGDVNMTQRKLQMAMQFDIPAALPLARDAVANKQLHPNYRVMGLHVIAKTRGKAGAREIAEMLEDQSECTRRIVRVNNQNVQMSIQIRDIALAWLVYLTDQQHADYHMPNAKAVFDRFKRYPQYNISIHSAGFNSNEDRDKAFKKWREWVAENPLPEADDEAPAEEGVPEPKEDKAAAAQRERAPQQAAQRAVAAPAGAFVQLRLQPGVPFGVPVPPGGVAGDDEDETPPDAMLGHLYPADREHIRLLSGARQLIEDERYAEAATLLGELLADENDYVFQPDRGVPLSRGLKNDAEQLLATLPPAGLDAYRIRYEPDARLALKEAVDSGDPEALADVSIRYFHTSSGAEAAYLLGSHFFDQGHPLRAAFYFDRLKRRSTDNGKFDPTLTVKLAASWRRAGLPDQADEVLAGLFSREPDSAVTLAGQPQRLFEGGGRAAEWFDAIAPPNLGGFDPDDWVMLRGDAARNHVSEHGIPFVASRELTTIIDDPALDNRDGVIRELMDQQVEKHQMRLPSLQPLVVGDTIVIRTATHLRGIDRKSLKHRWEAPLEDTLSYYIEDKFFSPDSITSPDPTAMRLGLLRRLWENPTFGTMSSDGKLVFGVEDLGFAMGGDYKRTVVMPDGKRRLDTGDERSHNLLTAYDAQTGKLRWEVGGPKGAGDQPLAGTYFLGAPLPIGGKLYVVGKLNKTTMLMELDAATGDLGWRLALNSPEDEEALANDPFAKQMAAYRLPQKTASTPSCADGILVCPMSQNQFAAVDLTTRRLVWMFTAEDEFDEAGLARMGINILQQRQQAELRGEYNLNRWADASVTIAGGKVILTPADAKKMYCLNLADGRLQWEAPRHDGAYVGGVYDGKVVVVGRGSIWAQSLETGGDGWSAGRLPLPAGAMPSGRGCLTEGHYLLPLSTKEVLCVNIDRGEVVSRSKGDGKIIPGNLIRAGDSFFAQGADGSHQLDLLSTIDARLADQLESAGETAELLTRRGEILLYAGKIAEAVEQLRRAEALKSTPRSKELLAQALVQGLKTDFESYVSLVDEFEPAQNSPEQSARLLEQIADAQAKGGKSTAALNNYLKLIAVQPAPEKIDHVAATRLVRRDRAIAARIAALLASAAPADREALDRRVAEYAESASSTFSCGTSGATASPMRCGSNGPMNWRSNGNGWRRSASYAAYWRRGTMPRGARRRRGWPPCCGRRESTARPPSSTVTSPGRWRTRSAWTARPARRFLPSCPRTIPPVASRSPGRAET